MREGWRNAGTLNVVWQNHSAQTHYSVAPKYFPLPLTSTNNIIYNSFQEFCPRSHLELAVFILVVCSLRPAASAETHNMEDVPFGQKQPIKPQKGPVISLLVSSSTSLTQQPIAVTDTL